MKKIIKNILFLFFIFWSFFFNAQILNAKTLPPGTGIADVPANILLMLDTSGSMGWPIGTTDAILKYPTGVDVDSSGNIYVIEYYSCKIKKFSSDGTFIKKVGTCGRRNNTIDMYLPEDIAICGNYIAIANTQGGTNYRGSIKIFDLDLNPVRERNVASGAYYPYGVEWDANCDYIYHTSVNSQKIHKINAGGLNTISDYGNGYGTGSGYMIYPIHLDLDSNGNIYVAEYWNHRVSKFNSSGTFVTSWGSYGSGNGNFKYAWGVAVDSSDNVFVSDLYGHRVQKFDVDGTYSTQFGSFGTGNGELYYPYGIGVDSDDQVYVTEWGNERVSRFTNTGTFVDLIGRGQRRIDIAIKAIKKILSDPDLVGKAHYGLLTWASSSYSRKLRVKIDKNGASKIPGILDTIYPSGGTDLGSAMQMARTYFRGGLCCDPETGKTYVSPQDPAAKDCQENILIAISDGDWQYGLNPDPIAQDLLSSDKIKTYALGYGGYTSSKSRYESLAKAGGTDTPLYADNYDQLVRKLSDAIRQVYGNLNLTYTAPKFMAEKDSGGNALGDFVYQSTFEYVKKDQWKGKLAKKELDANGDLKKDSSGDTITIWDAGTKLNAKSSDDRNIWTIGFGLTSTDGKPNSYNNFTTANIANFYSQMFAGTTVTSSEAEDHISFVRGYDTYDTDEDGSTTDTRWKLADIFNSEMAVVFPPNIPADEQLEEVANTEAAYRKNNDYDGFKSKSLSGGGTVGARKKIVLVGSNGGMLHAFNVENGEELWAFIPPALIYNLKSTMSDFTNQTNSISGVDGSPVVKDIYYDNGSGSKEWRTIALVGMGPGGKGYFALDITDTEKPTHLFSFDNDPVTRTARFWNDDGDEYIYSYSNEPLSSVAPDYDYSNLGNAYSTPHILRMGIDGEDKWVAVFGGGYNIGSMEYASSIFVVDLEDGGINNAKMGGKLIKDINLVDKKQKEREPSLNTNNSNEVIHIADGSNDEFEVTFRYDNTSQVEVYVGTVDANEVFSGSRTTAYSWKNKYYIQFNASSIPANDAAVKIKRNPAILDEEINNSVPARLTMLTADNVVKAIDTATYKGAMIYVTDIEGNVWKVDMTGNTASFKKNILFDAEGDTLNQRYTFYDMAAAEFQEKIWLYFGTGNIRDVGLVDDDIKKIKIKNRIYGIKDKNFPSFIEIDDTTEKNLLTSQNYEQGSLTIKECSDGSPCPPRDDQLGWYTNMKDDSGNETKNEKVTGKVLVTNKKVYVTRYQPQINKPCEAGKAYLSSHKYNCGSGVSGFAGTQGGVLELGVGIATGAIQFKDNIYVGISGEEKKTTCQEGDPFCVQDNIVRITSPDAQQGGTTIEIDSWRELF